MRSWFSIFVLLFLAPQAYAEGPTTEEVSVTEVEDIQGQSSSVQSTIGGGIGFMQLLHFDYSRMLDSDRSFDVSVTPLVMLNIGSFGMTKYYLPKNQIFVSPNLMVFVGIMDGSPAIGPGVRIGYQVLGDKVGVKAYVGGNVLWTSMNNIQPGPDVGLTVVKVRR